MTYTEFETQIVELIKSELSDEHTTAIKPVDKNNGITLHGLIINNGKCNISPTIYLDYYYDEYKKGKDIKELANQVVTQYNKFKLEEDFDITTFTDFDKCKERITFKLVNYEKNKDLLKDIPHIQYLDLAIVFYCLLNSGKFETSSILIRNSHIEHWGIDKVDLLDIARENAPTLLESDIISLSDMVKDILARNKVLDIGLDIDDCLNDSTMYVLTNKIKLYGACCILYNNVLEEFAKKLNSDLYIIPSSVHEVLLLPDNHEYDDEYLSSLVKEVNQVDLQEEDILSDHIYFYDRKSNTITYPTDTAAAV